VDLPKIDMIQPFKSNDPIIKYYPFLRKFRIISFHILRMISL